MAFIILDIFAPKKNGWSLRVRTRERDWQHPIFGREPYIIPLEDGRGKSIADKGMGSHLITNKLSLPLYLQREVGPPERKFISPDEAMAEVILFLNTSAAAPSEGIRTTLLHTLKQDKWHQAPQCCPMERHIRDTTHTDRDRVTCTFIWGRPGGETVGGILLWILLNEHHVIGIVRQLNPFLSYYFILFISGQ